MELSARSQIHFQWNVFRNLVMHFSAIVTFSNCFFIGRTTLTIWHIIHWKPTISYNINLRLELLIELF